MASDSGLTWYAMGKTYVFYHANCHDGFGAAYAAWKKYGDRPVYLPVQHGGHVPMIGKRSTAYVVDFCFPLDELQGMMDRAERLVVIDHHESALDDMTEFASWAEVNGHTVRTNGLPDRPDAGDSEADIQLYYESERSGATMAWSYFVPDEPVPTLLKYVQDRDLWTWSMPDSRAFWYALLMLPMDFEVWDNVISEGDKGIERMRHEGKAIQRFVMQQVERTCQHARYANIRGHRVPCVNSTQLQSEIGEYLLNEYPDAPFAAIFGVKPDGDRVYSLRGRGDFDVAKVAATFGGGGHKSAAGFKTDQRL